LRAVRVIKGRKVVEFVFARGSKAAAVSFALRRDPTAFLMAFGDDVTDEDLFEAVRRAGGVSVQVGPRSSSRADFFLPGVSALRAWLERLASRKSAGA